MVKNLNQSNKEFLTWQEKISRSSDIYLMDRSIAENIVLYGKREINQAALNDSIKLAELTEFINLKEKENTLIGERGIFLSELKTKNRLARAFYNQRNINSR